MPELILTRGAPASGKSSWAEAWVLAEPEKRRQVNRDHFRKQFHVKGGVVPPETEVLITKLQKDAARAFLRQGLDVVVSDTNLRQRAAREWATLAKLMGAELKVQDFTHVPLEELLRRNAEREDSVPEGVIRGMHRRYSLGTKPLEFPLPNEGAGESDGKYEPAEIVNELPSAIICDLDGTVAKCGDRNIYDGSKAHLDTVHEDVWSAVTGFANYAAGVDGVEIIFMTGRSDEHRKVTEDWIAKHLMSDSYLQLHMRRAVEDKGRKDADVKYDLFNAHLRGKYNVIAAFDDRNQVVDLWRSMGIRTFQVAEGNF